MNLERIKDRWLLLFLAIGLAASFAFFYFPLLTSYFSTDDFSWIWFAATKPPVKMFFSPLDYRVISSNNFTPMLGLSYWVDWQFFGMEPKGYFAHNILTTLIAGASLFLFIGLYTDRLTAFAGLILFLLNPIVLSVTGWCATRHYMEGLFFALLALYWFVRKDRVDQVSLVSGGFYLMSVLCKEVYAVLPFIGLIISRGNIRKRLTKTLPMFSALLIYALWRLWMLGSFGGYPFENASLSDSFTGGIFTALTAFSQFLFNYQFALLLICIIMIVLTAEKMIVIKLGVLLVILFLPILPVIGLIESHFSWSRYFFHLSIVLVIVFVVWMRKNIVLQDWRKSVAAILTVVVVVLFVMRDKEIKKTIIADSMVAKSAADEYIFSDKPYIKQTQPIWFYDGLHDLYLYFYDQSIHTKLVPDDTLIPYLSREKKHEISSAGYQLPEHGGSSPREDTLQGTIDVRGYRFTWTFGPYTIGRYFILKGRESGLYNYLSPLKTDGVYQFGQYYPGNKKEFFYLRVLYRSPEGWEAISKEYRIEVPGNISIPLGSFH